MNVKVMRPKRSTSYPLFVGLVAALLFLIAASFAPAVSKAHSAEVPKIVVLGDSLSAGHQLPPENAFPVRLQAALDAKGVKAKVVGAAVSGDTTSSGLSRLDWSVPEDTDAVILELGANDALRGLPVAKAESNLDKILARLKERKISILFAGMMAPPNMGDTYGKKFNAIFPALAEKYGAVFYPFFLDGVAAQPKLNLADGIHPNPEGIDVIVERILPKVEELIARTASGGS